MATKKVDFRRLKEQRESLKHKKKIDSPLAKYNSLGQLFCVLCNSPVKNELLWTAHIQSKRHKENFVELKNKEVEPVTKTKNQQRPSNEKSHSSFAKPATPVSLDKRKSGGGSHENEIPEKRAKAVLDQQSSSLPDDFFDSLSKGKSKALVDEEEEEEEEQEDETEANETAADVSDPPEDFFDSQDTKKVASASSNDSKTSKRKHSEELPEGFFDDPKQDAKARKVEYKDPQDEEWEKFQKAMQMENQVSEALVEEDDEVARIDRQLTELSEQRQYFLRAHSLRDKQTIIKDKISQEAIQNRKDGEDNDASSDSEDFDEFFDWRAKKVL